MKTNSFLNFEKVGFFCKMARYLGFVVQANKFTGHGYYTIQKVSFASRGNFHSGGLLFVFQFCEALVATTMCHETDETELILSKENFRKE